MLGPCRSTCRHLELPSDHGPGALADYVTGQGAATIVIPRELEDVAGLATATIVVV